MKRSRKELRKMGTMECRKVWGMKITTKKMSRTLAITKTTLTTLSEQWMIFIGVASIVRISMVTIMHNASYAPLPVISRTPEYPVEWRSHLSVLTAGTNLFQQTQEGEFVEKQKWMTSHITKITSN